MHSSVHTPPVTNPAPAASPAVIGKDSRGRWCLRAVEDGSVSPVAGKFEGEAAGQDLSGEPELEPEPKAPRDNDHHPREPIIGPIHPTAHL